MIKKYVKETLEENPNIVDGCLKVFYALTPYDLDTIRYVFHKLESLDETYCALVNATIHCIDPRTVADNILFQRAINKQS